MTPQRKRLASIEVNNDTKRFIVKLSTGYVVDSNSYETELVTDDICEASRFAYEDASRISKLLGGTPIPVNN